MGSCDTKILSFLGRNLVVKIQGVIVTIDGKAITWSIYPILLYRLLPYTKAMHVITYQ